MERKMEQSAKQLLFGLMGGIFHDTRKILDEIFKPMNLSRSEWLVLAMLRLQRDGLPQGEAMKYVGVEKSYFSKMLNLLEDKGYIVREIDTNNRRNRIIKINHDNTDQINKVFNIIRDYTDDVQVDISEEEAKTVRAILLKVQDRINNYNN